MDAASRHMLHFSQPPVYFWGLFALTKWSEQQIAEKGKNAAYFPIDSLHFWADL